MLERISKIAKRHVWALKRWFQRFVIAEVSEWLLVNEANWHEWPKDKRKITLKIHLFWYFRVTRALQCYKLRLVINLTGSRKYALLFFNDAKSNSVDVLRKHSEPSDSSLQCYHRSCLIGNTTTNSIWITILKALNPIDVASAKSFYYWIDGT